jgi:hypothetical protein
MRDISAGAIRGAWAVLDRPVGEQLATLPLELLEDTDIRLGIDSADLRHVLVELEGDPPVLAVSTSNLSVSTRSIRFASGDSRYLDVACLDPDLNDLFDELTSDVLSAAVDGDGPAVQVVAALSRWRLLFKSRSQMARESVLGLFAELHVLRVALEIKAELDLATWTGPLRFSHDFEFPRGCLEVKAVGATSAAVRIHGLDQLETHDSRPLFLSVLSIEESPDGLTIDELIGDVRATTTWPDVLDSLLANVRPIGSSVPAYKLAVASTHTVSVDMQLPRMTSDSHGLDGISRVEYDLDLAVLHQHPLLSLGATIRDIL